jgi:hypothetical protein
MYDFVDFDSEKAWKHSALAIAKFRAQCDENGEPWDQVSGGKTLAAAIHPPGTS